MKPYYRAVVDAGLILQIDSPDLVDEWTWDRWTDWPAYRKDLEGGLEVLRWNTIEGLPGGAGPVALLLGQLAGARTASHCRWRRFWTSSTRSRRSATRSRPPRRTTPTSGARSSSYPLPDGKIVMPGVIDHTTPVIEHPQVIADRLVDLREGRREGERHGRHGLRHAHRLACRVGEAPSGLVEGAQLASRELFR